MYENEELFTCCGFQQKDEWFVLLADNFWAGVHDKVQFFAEELVFAGNRHVVYDAAGVVMFDATLVKDINTGTFCGGKNE